MSKKVNNNVPKLRFPEFEGDWNEIAISSIGEVIRGASPRPKGDTRYYGGKIPRLMVEDVSRDGKHVTPRTDFLTEEGAKLSRPCEKGTLTIVCSGTVGIPSFLAVDACIHDGFLAIKKLKKEIIYDDFLYHQLTILRNVFESSATHGGVFTNLTTEILRNFKIKSTSIAEQEKIASFLGAIDTRITQLRRKHELLQTYKRGVMQKLFSQQIRFKCDRGKPFPDWEKKKLGSITKIYDGTHQTPNYVSKGVSFYSVEHLTSNNFTDTKFISEEVFLQENKRICLEKGDILMTRIGDIGTCRLIDWDVRASFYVSLALIKSNKIAISGFLTYFMSSIYFQRELHKRTIHVAFPKKINLGEIGNCRIAIPCINEQEKIADFLIEIDQKIEAIAKQIDLTEQFKKGLLQKMFV